MVKEKQTRTYDQDGFRRRAACLCTRDPQESEILLVTSSRATDHWIVPGGGVEPNEDPSDAAIRETEEEAGVKGSIKRCLGDFEVRDENMERKHRTSVFVLEVHEELDEWEDSKSRKRRWFSLEEALKLLAIYKPVQCTYVNILIQTNSSLCHLAFHFPLSNVLPESNDSTSLNATSSSLKSSSSSPANTMTSYLQVNHYPKRNANSNNNNNSDNSNFQAFICTRNVYSTDSETTEDSLVANQTDSVLSNHCNNDNNSNPSDASNKMANNNNSNDCNKTKSKIIANSPVNS